MDSPSIGRPGKGETYFALPGAGIIQISADLKKTRMLETAEDVKKTNLHNSLIWYASRRYPLSDLSCERCQSGVHNHVWTESWFTP